MRPPSRIETDRLALRAPAFEDAPALFDTFTQDPEVTRYLTWRPHTHIGQTLEFIKGCVADWQAESRFPYAITLKGANAPIGLIDLHVEAHAVELGYVLGRGYWGHAYMPEAVRAAAKWAIQQPAVYRVYATCDVENAASVRVLEKAGFQREGTLRRYIIHPNISKEPRDVYLYATVRYSKTMPRRTPPPSPPPSTAGTTP